MTLCSGEAAGIFSSRAEFALDFLADLFRQLGFLELFAQHVDFGLLGILFAKFLLNGAQLLAQQVLALLLVHLRPGVVVDVALQLQHLDFVAEVLVHQPQRIGASAGFQQRLLLRISRLRIEASRYTSRSGSSLEASSRLTSAGACGCASSMAFVARSTIELCRASTSAFVIFGQRQRLTSACRYHPRSTTFDRDPIGAHNEHFHQVLVGAGHLANHCLRADCIQILLAGQSRLPGLSGQQE